MTITANSDFNWRCYIEHFQEEGLSQVWWVKCILRYIPSSEGVEGTTETQRTQRSIDPM
ncbi:hypothetical protein MiHa_04503 [Microcystis aeruginosa NIES-2522]|uniref:hypothetical protein n=1 Tax=Microcystis aeruginosa TaxID=1126 RepID=UPI00125C7FC5|nr:hypothetical protein [Microcystis aeruginosa]GCA86509.1 hypothetical protein MiHa_04503 [Microcystis aeruginosa NIES-2522]